MGDIDNTPTAASKGKSRNRDDSHDSPATEVGGVTVSLGAMSLTNSSTEQQGSSSTQAQASSSTQTQASSSTQAQASSSTQKPVWAGPKPEQSPMDRNIFGGQYMNAAANTFCPSAFHPSTFQPSAFHPSAFNPTASAGHVMPEATFLQQQADQPLIVRSTPVGAGKGKEPVTNDGNGNMPAFTTDASSQDYRPRHFVKIDNVALDALQLVHLSGNILQTETADSEVHPGKTCVYICFDDLRDACKTAERASATVPTWDVQFLPDSLFKDRTGLVTTAYHDGTSKYDGQVLFVAKINRQHNGERLAQEYVPGIVQELAASFGDVINMQPYPHRAGQGFRVEYWAITAAKEAVAHLSEGKNIPHFRDGWDVSAQSFAEVLVAASRDAPEIIMSPTGRTAWSFDPQGNMVVEKPMLTVPKANPAMTATTTDVVPWSPARPRGQWTSLPMPQTQQVFDPSLMARSTSHPVGNHVTRGSGIAGEPRDNQEVSVARISNGQDVRTTVMIRNVPNEWTCEDMKTAVDAVSFGKYDFAYLRIDFERNLNVGYGFVNFIDAESIIPFLQHYHSRDWNQHTGLPGRRLGQVSYATIQGYDCLIEKFRNSAIMDECPGYRPKIFYTFLDAKTDDLVGTEKDFPKPNNASKHKRSAENAGQIGLFQPNSRGGDRVRGGDRARRSQYDRGTTRQMAEDASYYYAHAAGPAYGGMAPIGTPAMAPGMYPHHAGYPQMGQQFYNGFPPVDPMGANMIQYQGQYQHYQYPGNFAGAPHGYPGGNTGFVPFTGPGQAAPGYGQAAHGYGYGYNTNNRASQLRTLTNGRLATRPRGNVTVADPSRYDPAPGVPRSIVANQGEFPPVDQYALQQYYAANAGYAGVQAPANGNHYQYSQY
ncbi:hypothetical protein M409DRAFT_16718 [Zasmidium cellare ATCC 36951]|uniref:RRM domain-containing protein n=1 Tax=Zasmidium cellare ATCC 36951 TaxID=1080233 RepID=A0A6A6D148_ZASCE|nr:uncharacterized protein M409DRAFT_16718 [Zasmidium cellare ATCC 36951]KAF2172753.1 hypothetical protein M409DRAFT_16718 [Zasmidium cellare ATCC 36951]